METIYQKIASRVRAACPDVIYEEGYPRDYVRLKNSSPEEDEDTLGPLLEAMQVIMSGIEDFASVEDDIEVKFYHLPFEEEWGISIGDGR